MTPMVTIMLFAATAVPVSGLAFSAGPLHALNSSRNSSMPRVLLFVTTYPSDEHVSFMKCQAELLARTQMLKEAHVLLHVGLSSQRHRPFLSHEAWRKLLDAWPMHKKMVRFSTNPGKQQGAKRALHEALTFGWFRDYDWVVRINPDVIIYDERPLFSLMQRSENWAVVAKCGVTQTNSDFFAIRPEHVPIDAFSEWNLSTPDAEGLTDQAFRHIYDAGAYAFLKRRAHQDGCHLQDGGVYHGREPSCEMALARKGWKQSFDFRKPIGTPIDGSTETSPWQEAWRLGA
jgi:hypothetical protein